MMYREQADLYCLVITAEFDILLFNGMKIYVNHFVPFSFKRSHSTFLITDFESLSE